MANFGSSVQDAYKRKWSFINNFICYIGVVGTTAVQISNDFAVYWRDLELNIKDVTVPQYSYDGIDFWMVDRYRHTVGKTAPMTITITFRDQDQMRIYRTFLAIFEASKAAYPDDAAMSIKVCKGADYLGELDNIIIFDGKKALISSVSQLSFSNETEAQIAEFSVEFYVYEYTIHG